MDRLIGFQDLTFVVPLLRRIPVNCPISPQDQQKIRLAISLRRVDPADIPASAKSVQTARLATAAKPNAGFSKNNKKRKADETTSTVPTLRSVTGTLPQPSEEDQAEEVAEEEVRDELYCTMHTNVVGIQYYKGCVNTLLGFSLTSCFNTKVSWGPEKKFF